ncbi:MAG TPA: YARHG domain-containing protein [Xanthobacteraceae bacterium]|nr:YARHG domain-containing protein [Xanthobacteraceae bacterium]
MTSYASAQSCQQLWVERNSFYKDAGYCFKTDRAIAYFGNQAVPLSRDARYRIDEIVRLERRMGCND